MGEMVRASCKCGFWSGTLCIGSGYMDYDLITSQRSPAICITCGTIHLRKYYARNRQSVSKQKCGRCKQGLHFLSENGYFSPADLLKTGNWFPWQLTLEPPTGECINICLNLRFTCPKCQKMAMTLESEGRWD